jgi:flagellar motor switch protein FliN
MIIPIIQRFGIQGFGDQSNVSAKAIDSVKIEVSVVLGQAVMPIHQLLKMGRGAVIELESLQTDPVLIYANKRLVARGEIMIQGEAIAVSIRDLIQTQ